MLGPISFSKPFRAVLAALLAVCISNICDAGEPVVKFDVPALVGVVELELAPGHHSHSATQKIIEVVIPVSTSIQLDSRDNVAEFRFDVYWNRNVYPLDDYAPKTQTASEIEGLISVEESKDNNAGVGVNLKGGFANVITATANADLSQRNGTKLKYQQVPDHDVLVASGTIQRGTGAFFRFHNSKRETLEGGRDLVVAYRVPQSWRGGVIKVECRAQGQRKIVGSWRESFEESRVFVLPVYLEGDDQARLAAEDFVRSEHGLRQHWIQHRSSSSKSSAGMFSFASNTNSSLPNQWAHHLIQSGNDSYLQRFRGQLPLELAEAADRFSIARQELFKFSR